MGLEFFVSLVVAVALGVYVGLHPEIIKAIFIVVIALIIVFIVGALIHRLSVIPLFSYLLITVVYYIFFKMVVFESENKTIRKMGIVATVLWIILLFGMVVGTFGGFFK